MKRQERERKLMNILEWFKPEEEDGELPILKELQKWAEARRLAQEVRYWVNIFKR